MAGKTTTLVLRQHVTLEPQSDPTCAMCAGRGPTMVPLFRSLLIQNHLAHVNVNVNNLLAMLASDRTVGDAGNPAFRLSLSPTHLSYCLSYTTADAASEPWMGSISKITSWTDTPGHRVSPCLRASHGGSLEYACASSTVWNRLMIICPVGSLALRPCSAEHSRRASTGPAMLCTAPAHATVTSRTPCCI